LSPILRNNLKLEAQLSGWNPYDSSALLSDGTRGILVSMMGYFLADLVAIREEWKQHKVSPRATIIVV
jgi:hypothetical protein